MDENIDKLKNKTIIVEFNEADNENDIGNCSHEFDLALEKELKLNALLAEEKIKKVIIKKINLTKI